MNDKQNFGINAKASHSKNSESHGAYEERFIGFMAMQRLIQECREKGDMKGAALYERILRRY